jgi:hypothetical protein
VNAHDERCERLPDFYMCHCNKRERLAKGPTELPTLSIQYPVCNGCGRETWHDGDSYRCDRCHVTWSSNAGDGEQADHFVDDMDWTDVDGVLHTLEEDRQAWIDRRKTVRS